MDNATPKDNNREQEDGHGASLSLAPAGGLAADDKLYIYMRGAGGMMAGTHPLSRIPRLVALMLDLTVRAAEERDAPPSLTFYENTH